MPRHPLLLGAALLTAAPLSLPAQEPSLTTVVDSIEVLGARRVPAPQVIAVAAIPLRQEITYRDVQRAIASLYASGQYDDVRVSQDRERRLLRIEVVERPLLTGWSVQGAERVSERSVRGRIRLPEGRPYDRAAAHAAVSAIDSLYRREGFYLADVTLRELPQADGTLRVAFLVNEGRRVAVSQIVIEGNTALSDEAVADHMDTGTEGFWWFQRGEYDDEKLERDVRERLPAFYGSRGYIDFRVLRDTLEVNETTGKGRLTLAVEEGPRYEVGNFEIIGHQRFSTAQLEQYYPFGESQRGFLGLGGRREGPSVFDEARWLRATGEIETLYRNNGYIYAEVRPVVTRRTGAGGTRQVDLRWQIAEGSPATIRKVTIVGNSVTHESVIRRATFPLVPGDVFRQQALLQAYQNVSNLGFFQQPLEIPQILPTENRVDVDVIFRVEERRTGNINFGASVGQGTGLGGFIGLDEPNVLGRGKRIQLQWQFGRNISDFNITFSDPAIRGGLLSGSVNLHSTRLRYTIADLGRIHTRGASAQLGFPFLGSRYTRLLTTYTIEQANYDSPTLSPRFNCRDCLLSAVGVGLVRDTRVDLPFPTGGALHEARFSLNGGVLGGDGTFQRLTLEGRWYAPLGQLGEARPGASGIKFLLGLTTKAGFVWGDAGPHFRQLFSMGGTQFGVPLRGYDEFSITPQGFDPTASGFAANTVDAFGASYFAATGEIGLRLSQALYLSTFVDAGNVWSSPGRFNPTRLFRGAGLGLAVLSPLGPIGIDYAYGFDRVDLEGNPNPGWKLHFKLGNIF
ncbi:MAG TPA: outer membrane protein assembly factor BamA [Gemmatimonadales bacterium]|nr:outer membrane protein assembly factor BamA [Gemmatimonadales bacterium]